MDIIEFTTFEFIHLVEKNERWIMIIFANKFIPAQDLQKGYQRKYRGGIIYNKMMDSNFVGVPVLS